MALRETTIELDVLVDADPLRDLNNQINDIANNMQNMGNISANVNQNITHHFNNQGQNLHNLGQNLNGVNQGYGNLTQITNHYYNTTNHNITTTNQNLNNHNNNLNNTANMYADLDDHAMAMWMNMQRGWKKSGKAMAPFLGNLVQARHGFFQLAQGMHRFQGTNAQFMGEVDHLGRNLKAAQDAMINNSLKVRQTFLEQIGLIRNMTTQASRISAEYARMGNPLYNINRASLAAADGLNRLANRGKAASLALARLGPTASMKELRDMTQMINQGLTRFSMVAIGAAIASLFLYKAMHKAAMENKEYSNAFTTMVGNLRKAIQPMVDAFIAIMVPVYNFINAMALLVIQFNKAHPLLAKIIQGTMLLIPALTLLLSPLAIGIGLWAGFHAALGFLWPIIGPVVTGLAAMSSTVWLVAAAIVVAVVALNRLWKTNEGFRDSVISSWNAIKAKGIEVFGWIADFIAPVINIIVAKFTELSSAIKAAFSGDFSQLGAIFKAILPSIMGMLVGGIPGLIIAASRFIPAIIQGISSNTGTLTAAIGNIADLIVNFLTYQLPKVIQAGSLIIVKLVHGIATALPIFATAIINIVNMVIPLIVTLLPILVQAGIQILEALITGIVQILPLLVTTITSLLLTIVNLIITQLPVLIQAGIQVLMALIDGIVQALPLLINAIVLLVTSILTALINNIPLIINAGIQILQALITGIVTLLPVLIEAAINLILQIVNALIANLPKIIAAGIQILTALIDGIIQVLPLLIQAALTLILALANGIIQNLPLILNAGIQIIEMLIKGIISLVSQLMSTVKSQIIDPLLNHFKGMSLLEIGKELILGLAKGITSALGVVVDAAQAIWQGIKGAFAGKSVSVPVSVQPSTPKTPRIGQSPVAAKVGLGRVPYDDFSASLHKDEAVLTARQANTLRSAGMLKGDGMGPSLNMNASDASDAPASAAATGGRSGNSLVFNPVFNFEGTSGDSKNIKQQFDDMKDEMFGYLTSVYDPGVDY